MIESAAVGPSRVAPGDTFDSAPPTAHPSPAGPNGPDSVERLVRALDARRRRTRIALCVVVATLLAVVAVGFQLTKSELPDPPEKTLESVRKVLPLLGSMPAAERRALAAEALYELEEHRLPKALRDTFGDLGRYGPMQARFVALRALGSGALLAEWSHTCPAGPRALAQMMQQPPEAQGAFLFKQCDLDRVGFLGEAGAAASDGPMLALSMVAFDVLKSKRSLLKEEDALLRVLVMNKGL